MGHLQPHSVEAMITAEASTTRKHEDLTTFPHHTSTNRGLFEDSENITKLSYNPKPYVTNMHQAPRFGHSNRLGLLTSSNPDDPLDYAQGLKAFSLFIVILFFIWGMVLIGLKFVYGKSKVGCAAGGEVVDMIKLSKAGIKRKERKKRILRSWRVQTTFCVACILIPMLSLMMMQCGWKSVNTAWEDVQGIVDDVDALAFRGWGILKTLNSSKVDLLNNGLVMAATNRKENENVFGTWCPNSLNRTQHFAFLQQAMETVESNTQQLVDGFENYVPDNNGAFEAITMLTEQVDASIDWFFSHDWIWKLILMVLNVLTVMMFMACYFLTKNDVIHEPTRVYLSWLILPLFAVFSVVFLMTTTSAGVATLVNADFCAGGPGAGSPQGAIEDAILSFQSGSLERQPLTGRLALVYDSFLYYSNGCLTDNPLSYFSDFSLRIEEVNSYLHDLAESLPIDDDPTIALLNQECGADVSFLPAMLHDLKDNVDQLQGAMRSLVDLSSCHEISPIVRRVTHGALCTESAYGLTWIWASSLVVCILCFVLLSTRAALFNSIKAKKRREKKPKRVVEKEFKDYKEFMAEFYKDTDKWAIQPAGKKPVSGKGIEIDFGSQIGLNPTFDTHTTTKLSEDELDQISNDADMNRFVDDDDDDDESSCGSSYESLSDDSESDDESDDDSHSALTSFISETRSIAKQTIDRIRNMAPLLARRRDANDNYDEDKSVEDESLYFSSPAKPFESDGLMRMETPTNDRIPLYGKSRVLSLLTPTAPKKMFFAIPRTRAAQVEEEEMQSLTTPTKPPRESVDNESALDPRYLKLSPAASPRKAQTPPGQRPHRRRLESEDSDDLTEYVNRRLVDAPSRPQKVYRNQRRTRASRNNERLEI